MTITSNPVWTNHSPPIQHRTINSGSMEPSVMTIQITVHGPDAASALAPLVDAVRALGRTDVTIDTHSSPRPSVYPWESGAAYGPTTTGARSVLTDRRKAVERVSPHCTLSPKARGEAALRILKNEHIALLDGVELSLPRREYDLLVHFAAHPRRVFTRAQLLRSVWGYDVDGGGRTVDVHVRRLRQKLGSRGPSIVTVRGVGYRLDDADQVHVVDTAATRFDHVETD